MRALSEPKGPVYLWARREVMEEDVDEDFAKTDLDLKLWTSVEPIALRDSGRYNGLYFISLFSYNQKKMRLMVF